MTQKYNKRLCKSEIYAIFAASMGTKAPTKHIMAKGSAMGIWRGRKGSTVFYYNRNSNNAQKQAMRERVYEISNPQSNAQVSQRMKLLPAQRVQQQLLSVLKRSWQGVEYGGKSLNQFMKYALKMTEGIPYVDKGDDRAIPGSYVISKGTIPQVYTTVEDIDRHYTSLPGVASDPSSTTWGEVCEAIINAGAAESGDQLTFVVCLTDASNTTTAPTARYLWQVRSVIVDSTSTQNLSEIDANWPISLGVVTPAGSDDVLAYTAKNNLNIAASAVVISRQSSTPMRSTAQLTVNENLLSYWFTQTRRSTARRSYQNQGGALSTNWPVDPDEEGGGGGSSVVDGTFEITGLTGTKATCNGKLAKVRINDDTGVPVAVYIIAEESGVIGSNMLVDNSNNRAITYTSEMQELGLLPRDVSALASLPTISV